MNNYSPGELADILQNDPDDADAWEAFGNAGGGMLNREEWSPKQCFEQAVEIDPNFARAWRQLAEIGGGIINGVRQDGRYCVIRSLEIFTEDAQAWNDLGMMGGGPVMDHDYNCQQCFEAALHVDFNYTGALNNLGAAGGGQIKGRDYTSRELYEISLGLEDRSCFAWTNGGACGGVTVRGKFYNEVDCYLQALLRNPKYTRAWRNLANAGGGYLSGTEFDVRRCWEIVLEQTPEDADAWYIFGMSGGGAIGGTFYEKKDCLKQVLEMETAEPAVVAQAWNNLGFCGGATIEGEPYDIKSCFVQSLEVDGRNAIAWNNLGILGGGCINDVSFSSIDCFRTAIDIDPTGAAAWLSFGISGGGVLEDGSDYSERDCIIRCIELEPADPKITGRAWAALGHADGGPVDGEYFSRDACYVQAKGYDPSIVIESMPPGNSFRAQGSSREAPDLTSRQQVPAASMRSVRSKSNVNQNIVKNQHAGTSWRSGLASHQIGKGVSRTFSKKNGDMPRRQDPSDDYSDDYSFDSHDASGRYRDDYSGQDGFQTRLAVGGALPNRQDYSDWGASSQNLRGHSGSNEPPNHSRRPREEDYFPSHRSAGSNEVSVARSMSHYSTTGSQKPQRVNISKNAVVSVRRNPDNDIYSSHADDSDKDGEEDDWRDMRSEGGGR